jgi:V/A-type H+-transporting ATPase subunit E
MADQIRDLIEKIQQEGVRAAEDKAKEIENQAECQAEEIIKKAKLEAGKLIREAKEEIAKSQESSKILLKQAGRDLIISLKKEINKILDKLILFNVRQALSPEELAKILSSLIKNYSAKENVIISLNKEDLRKLEKGLLDTLKEEVKKGITLRPSDDIQAGFIISYDSGKSYYDFTDTALTEYIGSYLKPKLKEILE